MKEDSFEYCCDIADLDPGWCRELLLSVLQLPEPVRRDITAICMRMLDFTGPLMEIDIAPQRLKIGDLTEFEVPFVGNEVHSTMKDKIDSQIKKRSNAKNHGYKPRE